MRLNELAKLQKDYRQLLKTGITKKAMCELVIPFRDKWGLSDLQALAIARNEISLDEICNVMTNLTQTKADRIRAMSDEELATFLECFGLCHYCTEHHRLGDLRIYQDERCDEMCEQHCLEWLKQPAEVSDG